MLPHDTETELTGELGVVVGVVTGVLAVDAGVTAVQPSDRLAVLPEQLLPKEPGWDLRPITRQSHTESGQKLQF